MSAAHRLTRILIVAGLLALGPQVLVPRPVAACSCVAPLPLAQYAGSGYAILAGHVEGRDARGVRVAVARWFAGPGAAPTAWITGSFGDSASCGVGEEPAAGTDWIWVAWRPEDERDLTISICAPTAMLDTEAGGQLLAEANRTFGPGAGFEGASGDEDGLDLRIDPALAGAGALVLVAGAMVLVGAVVAARRPRA